MFPEYTFTSSLEILPNVPNGYIVQSVWFDLVCTDLGAVAAAQRSQVIASDPNGTAAYQLVGVRQKNSEHSRVMLNHMFRKQRLAPRVDPRSEGHPIFTKSGEYEFITGAYFKLLDKLEVMDLETQLGVQSLTSNLVDGTPLAARALALANEIHIEQLNAIRRTKDVMCFQLARFGYYDTNDGPKGYGYPGVRIDFGRKANLTMMLTGTARWGYADATIFDNILELSQISARDNKGGKLSIAICGSEMASGIRRDQRFKDQTNTFYRGTDATLKLTVDATRTLKYIGTVDAFEFYEYTGYYEDEVGNTYDIMLPNEVVLMDPQSFEGWQINLPINHVKAITPQARNADVFQLATEKDDAWNLESHAHVAFVSMRINAAAAIINGPA